MTQGAPIESDELAQQLFQIYQDGNGKEPEMNRDDAKKMAEYIQANYIPKDKCSTCGRTEKHPETTFCSNPWHLLAVQGDDWIEKLFASVCVPSMAGSIKIDPAFDRFRAAIQAQVDAVRRKAIIETCHHTAP